MKSNEFNCNFLEISPNYLFDELLTFKEKTLDTDFGNYISKLSKQDKDVLKEIIIHIDRNYF